MTWERATKNVALVAGAAVALRDLRLGLDRARTPAEYTDVLDKAAAINNRGRRLRAAFLKRDLLDMARDAYRIQIEAAFVRAETAIRIAERLPDRGRLGRARPAIYSADDYGIHHSTAARWKRYLGVLGDGDLGIVRVAWLELAAADPAGWEEPTQARIFRWAARMQEDGTMTTDPMICPRCGEVTIAIVGAGRRRCFRCWSPSNNTPPGYQPSLRVMAEEAETPAEPA